MMLTIDLPEEQAAALRAKAASAGLTLEAWLTRLANDQSGGDESIVHLQKTDPREWARLFRAWADGHDPNLPVLSDSAMRRDSIYGDLK